MFTPIAFTDFFRLRRRSKVEGALCLSPQDSDVLSEEQETSIDSDASHHYPDLGSTVYPRLMSLPRGDSNPALDPSSIAELITGIG